MVVFLTASGEGEVYDRAAIPVFVQLIDWLCARGVVQYNECLGDQCHTPVTAVQLASTGGYRCMGETRLKPPS